MTILEIMFVQSYFPLLVVHLNCSCAIKQADCYCVHIVVLHDVFAVLF